MMKSKITEDATISRSALEGMIHHSDRGSQYLSKNYTDMLNAAEEIKKFSGTV